MPRARAKPDPSTPDEEARAELETVYRGNASWLRTAILRRFGPGLASDVDDLVQETYIRVARLQAKGPVRSPRALLAQIARRLAIDQVRRQASRAGAASDFAARAPAGHAAEQEELVLLKSVVLSMPEHYRTVFLLARFEGLTHAQIAKRLGVSQKAVEWRLTQALAHCQTLLQR